MSHAPLCSASFTADGDTTPWVGRSGLRGAGDPGSAAGVSDLLWEA
ncbi:hypothetical protein AB0E77_11505 [Streptomyces sp. NPDC032940]